MLLHLSKLQVDNLQEQAVESLALGDDGEAFAEEALTYLSEDEIEEIEDLSRTTTEEFFLSVFEQWDDDEDVIEVLGSMLEDLDIELTYDEDDEEEVEDDSDEWGSDDNDEDSQGFEAL